MEAKVMFEIEGTYKLFCGIFVYFWREKEWSLPCSPSMEKKVMVKMKEKTSSNAAFLSLSKEYFAPWASLRATSLENEKYADWSMQWGKLS